MTGHKAKPLTSKAELHVDFDHPLDEFMLRVSATLDAQDELLARLAVVTEALERVARDRRDADADMKAEWGKVDGASLYGHAWGYMTNAFNHVDAALSATPEALTTWRNERDAEPKKVIENLHWRIGKLELMLKNATDDRLKEALRQPPAPIVLSLGDSAAFARGVEAAIAKVEPYATEDNRKMVREIVRALRALLPKTEEPTK